MIRGHVTANQEAVIRLDIFGPRGGSHTVDAIIDTGFSGFLTLPPAVITSLQLPFRQTETYTLAEDTDVALDVYACSVLWDGQIRRIFELAADAAALVGMSLIHGHRLTIEALDGGAVSIESLR